MEVVVARVVLLDGFGVHVADAGLRGAALHLPQAVQRLVAYLGLSRRPARSAVAGQLWPEVSEAHAHSSLRSALWRLHKAAPGLVDASGGTLALARGVRVDVRDLTSWAQGALDPRTDVDAVTPLHVAGSGELLPGWYEDWVLQEREQLRQLRLHALDSCVDKLTHAGRYGEAVHAAHSAVRAEPLRETAHRALVRAHLAEGNVAEALHAYESFRSLLLEELGISPTPAMEALVSVLRRPQPVRALAAGQARWPRAVR
jgi:DNA-binding SARP family transcriptional activator